MAHRYAEKKKKTEKTTTEQHRRPRRRKPRRRTALQAAVAAAATRIASRGAHRYGRKVRVRHRLGPARRPATEIAELRREYADARANYKGLGEALWTAQGGK